MRIKIYHIRGTCCPLLISINIDQGTEKRRKNDQTGTQATHSRMEKHKAVDYLRKVQSYHRTASEAPLIYDVSLAGERLPDLVTLCVRASLLQ